MQSMNWTVAGYTVEVFSSPELHIAARRDGCAVGEYGPWAALYHGTSTRLTKEHSFMTKQLRFNVRARYSIKKGVDTLTNAVKVTIGPKGRNVVVDKPLENPIILNDGVAIARDFDLEEPFAN